MMMPVTWDQWVSLGTKVIVVCSVLHNILPPWEKFADFPRVQKVYKLLVYIIGYVALNARSTLWQSISIKNQPQGGNSQ